LKVVFNYNLPLDEFHPLTNHENHQTIKTCITFLKNSNIQMMRTYLSMTQMELIIEEKIMATVEERKYYWTDFIQERRNLLMFPMQLGEGNGWNLESNVVLPT